MTVPPSQNSECEAETRPYLSSAEMSLGDKRGRDLGLSLGLDVRPNSPS